MVSDKVFLFLLCVAIATQSVYGCYRVEKGTFYGIPPKTLRARLHPYQDVAAFVILKDERKPAGPVLTGIQVSVCHRLGTTADALLSYYDGILIAQRKEGTDPSVSILFEIKYASFNTNEPNPYYVIMENGPLDSQDRRK